MGRPMRVVVVMALLVAQGTLVHGMPAKPKVKATATKSKAKSGGWQRRSEGVPATPVEGGLEATLPESEEEDLEDEVVAMRNKLRWRSLNHKDPEMKELSAKALGVWAECDTVPQKRRFLANFTQQGGCRTPASLKWVNTFTRTIAEEETHTSTEEGGHWTRTDLLGASVQGTPGVMNRGGSDVLGMLHAPPGPRSSNATG